MGRVYVSSSVIARDGVP